MTHIAKILTINCLAFCLSLAANISFAGMNEAKVAYAKGDYVTAAKETRILAEQGNIQAQYELGILYENGQGVKQDYKQAFKWYSKMAEQGGDTWYIDAFLKLSMLYATGRGVEKDYVQAWKWADLAMVTSWTNGYDNTFSRSTEILKVLEKEMTEQQIDKAKSIVSEWVNKRNKPNK